MATNSDFLELLYAHVLLRKADVAGFNYYLNGLDSWAFTRAKVVEAFAQSPELAGVPTELAGVYQGALGRQPDMSGLQFWSGVYQSGASLAQIADAMIQSAEFANSYPSATTSALVIDQIYQNSLGRSADAGGLKHYVKLVKNGTSLGAVAEFIALSAEARSKNEMNMKKTLLWHAVVGDEPTPSELSSLSDTSAVLAVQLMNLPSASTGPGEFWESLQTVYGSAEVTDVVTVDLVKNTLTMGSAAQNLASGALTSGRNVNFSDLTLAESSTIDPLGHAVVFVGDSSVNTYVGSNLGDSIDAGGGNDVITLGSGKDVVSFANTASANGIDTIANFSLGVDQLDVGRFLQKTSGAVELVSVDAATAPVQSWANGDIIVVQGSGLLTSKKIADLFGPKLTLPSGAEKVVVISADITGDARIWYVTNSTDPAAITAAEVAQVGVLDGVHGLLDQANLASLRASMGISPASAQLIYSESDFEEAPENDGSVSTTATIELVGDKFVGVNGAPIGKVAGLPAGLKYSLVKISDTEAELSFSGNAKKHDFVDSVANMTVTFDAKHFVSGKAPLNAVKDDFTVSFFDVNITDDKGTLRVVGAVPLPLVIDKSADVVTSKGIDVDFGSLGGVATFDLSKVTTAPSITVIGSTDPEKLISSPVGATLRGGGGNDTIVAGTGVDKIVFDPYYVDSGSSVINMNGFDRIENFKVGNNGDILDFSNFLGITDIKNIPPHSAFLGTDVVPCSNGQVLVVQGFPSLTVIPKDIQDLFDPLISSYTYTLPPGEQVKLVVITSDVVGDAHVWYVFDQTTLGTIEFAEVVEVATLVGVNNLIYNQLVATNFA